MSETRVTAGEARTVNVGDRVVDLRDVDTKFGATGVVDTVGRIVNVDMTIPYENDDDTMTMLSEYVPYRVWQLAWCEVRQAWTIDQQGISAHALAMEG